MTETINQMIEEVEKEKVDHMKENLCYSSSCENCVSIEAKLQILKEVKKLIEDSSKGHSYGCNHNCVDVMLKKILGEEKKK